MILKHLSESELAVLVGRIAPSIRKIGSGYLARCPFPGHTDRHPSFHVWTGKEGYGCWYCPVCQKGGDDIDFKRIFFKMSFRQAAGIAPGAASRPDPALVEARQRQCRIERAQQELRDRFPDLPDEALRYGLVEIDSLMIESA